MLIGKLKREVREILQTPCGRRVECVQHAEMLVRLEPAAARNGSYVPPPAKANAGLPEPIRRLLERPAR